MDYIYMEFQLLLVLLLHVATSGECGVLYIIPHLHYILFVIKTKCIITMRCVGNQVILHI